MPSSRRTLILLSPLIVIAIGNLTARFAGNLLGDQAWMPLVLVFWAMLAIFIVWGKGGQAFTFWMRSPQGAWGWSVLAMAIGLLPLPILLSNWQLLKPPSVWLPWLIFALVNPFLEEGYWRGLLLDTSENWTGWLSVPYTSLVFAFSHPLIWGVNSIGNRHPVVVISTFTMGLIWGVVYRKTRSLRWVIVSHILVDLFNLAIPVFMNIYTPGS